MVCAHVCMGIWVQQLESDHGLEGLCAQVQGLERLDFVKPNASKWGGTLGHRGPCPCTACKWIKSSV